MNVNFNFTRQGNDALLVGTNQDNGYSSGLILFKEDGTVHKVRGVSEEIGLPLDEEGCVIFRN